MSNLGTLSHRLFGAPDDTICVLTRSVTDFPDAFIERFRTSSFELLSQLEVVANGFSSQDVWNQFCKMQAERKRGDRCEDQIESIKGLGFWIASQSRVFGDVSLGVDVHCRPSVCGFVATDIVPVWPEVFVRPLAESTRVSTSIRLYVPESGADDLEQLLRITGIHWRHVGRHGDSELLRYWIRNTNDYQISAGDIIPVEWYRRVMESTNTDRFDVAYVSRSIHVTIRPRVRDEIILFGVPSELYDIMNQRDVGITILFDVYESQ